MNLAGLHVDVTTELWVVTDPSPRSELGDICFRATIADLALQVRGGLDLAATHAVLYGLRADARSDADQRLAARRAYDLALGRLRP